VRAPRWLWAACAAAVLLTVLGAVLLGLRRHAARDRDARARAQAEDKGPPVLVARADPMPAERTLSLSADVRALYQASVYAKVAGYVREVKVDKGDRVKKDQVLGTIESPQTDEATRAARADVALKERTAARARRLAPDTVSQQELEMAMSDLAVARANLAAALAQQGYQVLRAPFDGVVTARYVDPGALMPAATGSTQGGSPFVDVADPSTLRIQFYVGQDSAPFVEAGDDVTLREDARPDQKWPAKVTRKAEALDPKSRTMLVEVQFDNREAHVLPGTFLHVDLGIHAPPLPRVPAEALFVREGRSLVAVVENDHARFVEVEPGVSDGRTMQVRTGLRGGEMVALDLPTEVVDGGPVQAKPAPGPPPPASSGAHGTTAERH
jgi:RND family efflux transporter MFP subunit